MNRRFLAAVLCAALVLTLWPAAALAASSARVMLTDTNVTGGGYYKQLDGGGIEECSETDPWVVRYEPSTFILTLRGVTLSGSSFPAYKYAGIYASDVNLTINFSGTNTVTGMTASNPSVRGCGICVDSGSLTLNGEAGAVLNVTSSAPRTSNAVYASNDIVFTGGEINATASVTAEGVSALKEGEGVYARGNITANSDTSACTVNAACLGVANSDGSADCAGIYASGSISCTGSVTMKGTAGDCTAPENFEGTSSGISVGSAGSVTIAGGAYMEGVGGNAKTYSRGVNAENGSITVNANGHLKAYSNATPAPSAGEAVETLSGKINIGSDYTNAAWRAGSTAQWQNISGSNIDCASLSYIEIGRPRSAVTYDGNGGTGTMAPGTATDGVAFTLPACGFTAPAGQRFKEWAIDGTAGTKVAANGTYTFIDDTTVYAIWESISPVPAYQITEGQAGIWKPGGRNGLRFRANGDYDKFTHGDGIFVDGNSVSREQFTAESGSTIVTLNASYLETLSVGRHTLRISFDDGYAGTTFTIAAPGGAAGVPETGDGAEPLLLFGVALMAGAGLAVLRRKRRHG